MDYLDLIEEYKDQTALNLFSKVKIITTRTRDLYAGKAARTGSEVNLERMKPGSIAYYELNQGLITPHIYPKEKKVEEYNDDMGEE